MMRDYPATLEAVILDGTNSLSRKSWIEDRALDVDYALGHLDEQCRRGPKCREAYDIPALVERGLALFDAGPIAAAYVDPKPPGERIDFVVRQKDFVGLLYQLQESKYGVAGLPFLLSDLVKDGRASMAKGLGQILGPQLLQARSATPGAMAMLMHLAVVCSDDPVRSADELVLDGVRTRYATLVGRQFADGYVRSCDILRVPSLPDSTDVDITASIPTLILSGGLDVATPTYRSEIVARSLPRSRLVVFPAGTHVQLGAINLCAAQITVAFVRNPSGALPLKCVEETPFPGFVLPDGTVGR
jgi:pimeloyl-ACP methyl ester carboxylesterase